MTNDAGLREHDLKRRVDERTAELEAIIEATADGLMLFDAQGRILRMNPVARRLLGYSPDDYEPDLARRIQLSNLRWGDGSTVEDPEDLPVPRALRGETVRAVHIALDRPETRQRSWISVSAAPVRNAEGGVTNVVVTLSDVTELREAQEKSEAARERLANVLNVERARLAAVIENMPVGVMLAEAPSGRLVLANREAEEIWRQPFVASQGLEGYRVYKGFHPDGQAYQPDEWPLARSLSAGEEVHGEEIDFVRGDGSWGVMSVSSAPIYDRNGEVIAAVVSFADITERIEGERALRHTRDELASLLVVSQTLVSTLELNQVLALLVQELRAVIRSDGVTIYLIDGKDLVVQEYVGPVPREEALAMRMPLRKTAGLWQSVRDQKPVYIMDLEEDTPLARAWHAPQAADLRRLAGNARSYLAVPIVVRGQAIGVLRLTHSEPGRFTDEHARLATAIANQAAIAIENARLYRQAQEYAVLEERQRLARDLHDSVSQALFGVVMATHSALTNWDVKPSVARERVESASQLAKTAQVEMRALIFELRPDQLEMDGLVKALEMQTAALRQRRQFELDVALCEEPPLPLPVKEAFYRIAQEAVNNALKHAKPHRMAIELTQENGSVALCVADDGNGFDPSGTYPGHLGLRSMRERAERVGATLTIESKPESGTEVRLEYTNNK